MIAFLRSQIARARSFYLLGERGIPMIPRGSARRCVMLMSSIYGEILRTIEENGYNVFSRRAIVSGRRKITLAVGALLKSMVGNDAPHRGVLSHVVAPPVSHEDLMLALDRRIMESVGAIVPQSLRETTAYSTKGGKRSRGLLTMLACGAAGGREEQALDAAAAVELLHAASLVHDDIMDDSLLRRGAPTLHIQSGTSSAILTGDMLIALAMKTMQRGSNAKATDIFIDAFVRACEGQGYDITLESESADAKTHAKMVELKTAALLEAACAIGATIATQDERVVAILASYGHALGMAFQAQDDLLDMEGTELETGKSVGIDARNGRATYVLTATPSQIVDARAAVAKYTAQAIEALELLPNTPSRERLIVIANILATRKK
jgi:geranylgeranyl pyrophosphate synthase